MAVNNYNPERKIEAPPLPEMPSSPQPEFGREGSEGGGEFAERDNNISLPEVAGHFYNPSASTVSAQSEAKIIETIMEDGLGEMYGRMLPADQQKFKKKGEETANLIIQILSQPKIKIRKVFDLIRIWLKMIPGVNRFFLEQTAKIKTDKIISKVKDKKIV